MLLDCTKRIVTDVIGLRTNLKRYCKRTLLVYRCSRGTGKIIYYVNSGFIRTCFLIFHRSDKNKRNQFRLKKKMCWCSKSRIWIYKNLSVSTCQELEWEVSTINSKRATQHRASLAEVVKDTGKKTSERYFLRPQNKCRDTSELSHVGKCSPKEDNH